MDKILVDSAKFPLLKDNSLLSHYVNLTIENEEAALSVVRNIQSECSHKKCIEMRGRKPAGSLEKGPLESKHCIACGFTITRPNESANKVCIICWGAMKNLVHSYKCIECGHKERHT